MKRPEFMWDAAEPDHEALRNERRAEKQEELPLQQPDETGATDLPEEVAREIPEDLLDDIPPGDRGDEAEPGQDLPPAELPPRGSDLPSDLPGDLPPPDLPPNPAPDLPPDDLPGQPKPRDRR